jgi:hypothetical protein
VRSSTPPPCHPQNIENKGAAKNIPRKILHPNELNVKYSIQKTCGETFFALGKQGFPRAMQCPLPLVLRKILKTKKRRKIFLAKYCIETSYTQNIASKRVTRKILHLKDLLPMFLTFCEVPPSPLQPEW